VCTKHAENPGEDWIELVPMSRREPRLRSVVNRLYPQMIAVRIFGRRSKGDPFSVGRTARSKTSPSKVSRRASVIRQGLGHGRNHGSQSWIIDRIGNFIPGALAAVLDITAAGATP
jgi:hypothetical protein